MLTVEVIAYEMPAVRVYLSRRRSNAPSMEPTPNAYDSTRAVCSYLVAYVLTIEVMTVEKGVESWKSVRSCSVEVDESTEEPTSLSETVVMTQVDWGGY